MTIFYHVNITLLLLITSIFHQVASADDITVTQAMPSSALPGTEFTVELTITKGGITGFAKVQQELPPGFTATAIETQQANFSFDNQVVKFIWKSLPEESEFQLSYTVAVSANQTSGTISIGGIFAYLENNERKVIDIMPEDVFIGTAEKVLETEPRTSDEIAPGYIVSSSETTEEIPEKTETPIETVPETEPVSDKITVEYKIQIAAASNKIPTAYFINKYNITEQIHHEIHNEMNKYTLGSFSNYELAMEHMKFIRMNKGVEGAFITAYKNGKRIPVNEAHKISSSVVK